MEYIDIVDDNDYVVKTIERTPEWNATRPDKHRYIMVFLRDEQNRIILQQRSYKRSKYPGVFDASAGGLVSAGENYESCAIRELLEETGLHVPIKSVAKLRDYKADGTPWNHIGLFIGTGENTKLLSIEEEKVERVEYFTHQELTFLNERMPYLFVPAMKWVLPELVKFLKD